MRCWCVFVLSSANSDSIKNGKICNERLKRHQLLLLDFVCSVTQFEKGKKTKMWRLHWLLSSSILAFPFHTGSLLLGRGFHLRRHHHGSTARTVREAAFKKEKRFPPAAATTTRRYQFKKSAWTFFRNNNKHKMRCRAEPSRAAWFSSNTKAQSPTQTETRANSCAPSSTTVSPWCRKEIKCKTVSVGTKRLVL